MKNMMLQVKNFKVLAFCSLFLVALMGCEEGDPFTTPGKTENPNWTLTVENDMTASMTAIVKVSFTTNEGVLAAFMGNECCGVAEYIDGLYWLYMSPATQEGGEVQLRFYSPDLKRIFDVIGTFPFRNDTQLGTVSEPHTPVWKAAE
jgi:hypothetical protein